MPAAGFAGGAGSVGAGRDATGGAGVAGVVGDGAFVVEEVDGAAPGSVSGAGPAVGVDSGPGGGALEDAVGTCEGGAGGSTGARAVLVDEMGGGATSIEVGGASVGAGAAALDDAVDGAAVDELDDEEGTAADEVGAGCDVVEVTGGGATSIPVGAGAAGAAGAAGPGGTTVPVEMVTVIGVSDTGTQTATSGAGVSARAGVAAAPLRASVAARATERPVRPVRGVTRRLLRG